MLAIRMQRTGRKGHAEFRIIVQDSRRTPTSGVIVAQLGHYSPHSKQVVVDKEKAGFYLEHGAQPSERVVRLLTTEGIKMPGWVKTTSTKSKSIKHTEKLRKNRKEEPAAVASAPEEPVAEQSSEVKEEVTPPTAEAPADDIGTKDDTVATEETAEGTGSDELPASEDQDETKPDDEAPTETGPDSEAEEIAAETTDKDEPADKKA